MSFDFGVGSNQPSGARGTAGQTKDEVINGQFLQGTQGWTLGANWSLSGRSLLHEAGAIEAVSQDLAGATHTTVTYSFMVHLSGISAGTLTVTEGSGATGEELDANGWHTWEAVLTTDTTLAFTPSTDFDGQIDVVRVRALKVQP